MNFDFITERLAVGQKIDTQEFANALRAAGITHVVNLFGDHPEQFWAENIYLPQEDDGSSRSAEQIRAAISYVFGAIAMGRKVYIHCQWGIGRAPAMAYAILRCFGLDKEESITRLETRRARCVAGNWRQYIPSIEAVIR